MMKITQAFNQGMLFNLVAVAVFYVFLPQHTFLPVWLAAGFAIATLWLSPAFVGTPEATKVLIAAILGLLFLQI